MSKFIFTTLKALLIVIFISRSMTSYSAEEIDWRERMTHLIYTPLYFGPNAFPIPDLRSGKIGNKYEVEFRYDYHDGDGDQTKDLYGRLYIPFGSRAALELSGVMREDYKTSDLIRDQRYAVHNSLADNFGKKCYGDLIVTAMFQVLKSDKWLDIDASFGLKTASGNMITDARYTDAASYWFDAHFGRNLFADPDKKAYLRLAMMVGFYCYMTNSIQDLQNDAWMLGGGLKSGYRNISLDADLRGFQGYIPPKGDQPLLFQTKLKYTYKGSSLYFRYQKGLHDYIYQTYSVGYNFSF